MSRTISRSAVVVKAVATLGQDLHQVVGQVTAGQVKTQDGVGQSIT